MEQPEAGTNVEGVPPCPQTDPFWGLRVGSKVLSMVWLVEQNYLRNWLFSEEASRELPPRTIARTKDGYIEHRYHGIEHAPPHVHIIDKNGKDVAVGQNAKPMEGQPELNRLQSKLAEQFRKQIRKTITRMMKWYGSQSR